MKILGFVVIFVLLLLIPIQFFQVPLMAVAATSAAGPPTGVYLKPAIYYCNPFCTLYADKYQNAIVIGSDAGSPQENAEDYNLITPDWALITMATNPVTASGKSSVIVSASMRSKWDIEKSGTANAHVDIYLGAVDQGKWSYVSLYYSWWARYVDPQSGTYSSISTTILHSTSSGDSIYPEWEWASTASGGGWGDTAFVRSPGGAMYSLAVTNLYSLTIDG